MNENIELVKVDKTDKKLGLRKDDYIFKDRDKKFSTYPVVSELFKYEPEMCNIALKIKKFSNINQVDISNISNSVLNRSYKELNKSKEHIVESLRRTHYIIEVEGEINDKLVVGLGGHNVNETDITMHHTYGVPFIPGTTLKGVIKSCYTDDNSEEDTFSKKIFGNEDTAGKVIFMDSYPIDSCGINMDIMTPHHSKYNDSASEWPRDNDDITPIKFIVQEKGIYKFTLAIEKTCVEVDNIEGNFSCDDMKKLYGYLVDAVEFKGVGAKTSIGYGMFNVTKKKNIIENILKDDFEYMKRERERKEELERLAKESAYFENLSDVEKKIYNIRKLDDQGKNREVMNLVNQLDDYEDEEKIKGAVFAKEYLTEEKKWKKPKKKKKKVDNIIEKICLILNCEI